MKYRKDGGEGGGGALQVKCNNTVQVTGTESTEVYTRDITTQVGK